MQKARDSFGLGTFKHFHIDLPTASMRFQDAHQIDRIHARIQVAGSWSSESGSWLWPWDNPSLPADVQSRMGEVKAFGVKEGLPFLQAPVQPCDEGMAWSMASIAARLLDAQSLYRAPGGKTALFLLLFDIQAQPAP
ncbi:DUF6882 domain-containing protein [Variovorax sp. KK3]|nr:DUF6882 domain-containing protein [Variovorax sp. KK3]